MVRRISIAHRILIDLRERANAICLPLRLQRDGDMAMVEVEDAGPAIPAERAEAIFEPYVKDAALQNTGLGLGLWISRQIVEAHGGSISVESAPGEGATFLVVLPS